VTQITFVGTSDAFGAGGRRQSAILLRCPTGGVLVDCGTTTGSGLNQLGIAIDEIDVILVSHFHGDHFGGIPLLLLAALYEEHRKRALRIAGPPGIESRVQRLATAMGHPLDGREWSFAIGFDELPAGRQCELGPVRVKSFETHHSPDAIPHGLLIETQGARIAYSGDTGWFDGLPGCVAGSDLFVCECTSYHPNDFVYHLSHEELVSNRSRFDCGRMVITHLGEEMTDRRGTSEFEAADDGLTIRI
jgi:ribonuclease BN (tRNA processing enzyme)